MPTHVPISLRSGAILQAGIPKEPASPPGPIHGLVRGVVVATYCVDDAQHPMALAGQVPTAVACDVLLFGTQSGGSRFFFLPGVQVLQPFGGLHKGTIFKPKATTRLVSGKPLSSLTPNDVSDMDGDIVAVMMLDGRSNQPIIIGCLPHPSRDVGNPQDLPIGQRQKLKLADGDPFFFLHHAAAFGIADSGDFVVDTSLATQNGLAPNSGDAPGSPGNGSFVWSLAGAASRSTSFVTAGQAIAQEQLTASGYKLDSKLAPMSYQLTSAAGNGLKISGGGPLASLQVGSGQFHAAVAEQMALWWSGVIQPWLATHVHSFPALPAGPPTSPPTLPPPPFSPSILSTSVSLPG